ncbi:MAG TPA: S9 family peptidase [Sphingomicrobium sp.]|nr:S9 family peptidase [Sphingomicrobium sp.]
MRSWRVGLAVLTLGTSAASVAAPPSAPDPTFSGRDLFNLTVAADPQISPDGRWVAYVRRANDIMVDRARSSVWLINSASGEQRPLAAGSGDHHSPRWSPDGRRLAYVSTAEGSAPQLFVRWIDGGQSVRVTGLPDSPTAIAWSPDGQRIAYIMTVPDEAPKIGAALTKPEGAEWARPVEVIDKVTYRADGSGYLKPGFDQLFIVDSNGGAPRQMTFGAFHHEGPLEWTPDGSNILLSANRREDWELEVLDSEIHSLDVATGALRALTRRKGPDQAPSISPDGRTIAFLGFDDAGKGFEQSRLYLMNRDGSAPRQLAAHLDRGIDRIDWASDGRGIYAGYEEDGGYKVSRISLDGRVSPAATGLVQSALGRPYVAGSWSVARDGTIALTSGAFDRPADISVTRAASTRRLTRLNDLWLSGKNLAKVRELNARTADGVLIPGWLVTPPGYVEGTRVPLILEIHGGPYASYGPAFSNDVQLYAAAGYAVLYTNPRGSTGYGQSFADGIEKSYPSPNEIDLLAAVDAAVASGIADPENLFVTGGSGGGVLTSWLVGKTDRFRAAATQKPVINWTTQALVADSVAFFGRYWMGKMPWEDPQGYWARSPLSLVGNVKTPTLVVVGTEDYRTPVSEAEQYYTALKLRGIPTALVKVPGAPHDMDRRPSQSAARVSAILAWFEKYRKK